jgi:hypothetical protein
MSATIIARAVLGVRVDPSNLYREMTVPTFPHVHSVATRKPTPFRGGRNRRPPIV